MRRVLLVLVLIIVVGSLYGQQHPANQYDITKDNWWQWRNWTVDQQKFYVLGVLSGAYAMACDVSFKSGYVDLLRLVEDTLPDDYHLRDYHIAIAWIYEQPEMRTIPIWMIVFRVDEMLEIRRSYERNK